MSGLVSLIGAGPGDPELITEKGIDRLRRAEIVFHDKLSPTALLERHCRGDVEVRDVGKRKGKVGPEQHEINRMLVEAARDYRRVVRMKGGDPYLFGRGGEEAEHLARHDVTFEVIPGVSSLTAAPAAAGVPLTHRDHASSVGVITGHLREGLELDDQPWEALARMQTLVVFMGITRAEAIARHLMNEGRDPATPAALIGWGSTPRQATHVTDLAGLAEGVPDRGRFLPGLVVVGEVVEARPHLNWFETRPLFGRRIVVTRPPEQADRLAGPLREAGAEALAGSTIEIHPLASGMEETRGAVGSLERYDWLVLTSRNGVRFFFDCLHGVGRDARALGTTRIACLGPGTAERLEEEGLDADVVPEDHRAEGLLEALLERTEEGDRLLLPRAAGARALLRDGLEEAKRRPHEIALYEARPAGEPYRSRLEEWLGGESVDMVTFTSASTVDSLFEMVPQVARNGLQNVDCAALGPVTAAALRDRNVSPALVPDRYDIESFVEAILAHYSDGRD